MSVFLWRKRLEGKKEQEAVKPPVSMPETTFNYTKTEINRMSTSDLQELANELGFSNADEMTGGELKKVLIEKYNL